MDQHVALDSFLFQICFHMRVGGSSFSHVWVVVLGNIGEVMGNTIQSTENPRVDLLTHYDVPPPESVTTLISSCLVEDPY